MFCNSCGKELAAGHQFCASCGQPVGVAPVSSPGRVSQHVQILGILWLIYGGLELVGALVLLLISHAIFGMVLRSIPPSQIGQIPTFLQPLIGSIAVMVLVKAAACIAAGLGLIQHAPWARVLALVVGFISLINIPFGMGLGIYTIWVLLSAEGRMQYETLARA